MDAYEIREGYQEAMTFTLKHRVGPDFVAFDITGYTKVTLIRLSDSGKLDSINTVDNPTVLSVVSAPDGTVRLLPAATYWRNIAPQVKLHFEVIISGRIYMFPTRPRDNVIIKVVKE